MALGVGVVADAEVAVAAGIEIVEGKNRLLLQVVVHLQRAVAALLSLEEFACLADALKSEGL